VLFALPLATRVDYFDAEARQEAIAADALMLLRH